MEQNAQTASANIAPNPENTATVQIGGLVNDTQLQINKILASKKYILIAESGENVIAGIKPEELHTLLAHVYSYMLPRMVESAVYATIMNMAAQSQTAEAVANAVTEAKAGDSDVK